jgi:hypothetical protein
MELRGSSKLPYCYHETGGGKGRISGGVEEVCLNLGVHGQIWLNTNDLEHVFIIGSYFHYSKAFTPPKALDIRHSI